MGVTVITSGQAANTEQEWQRRTPWVVEVLNNSILKNFYSSVKSRQQFPLFSTRPEKEAVRPFFGNASPAPPCSIVPFLELTVQGLTNE
jgi:hypothetical protein